MYIFPVKVRFQAPILTGHSLRANLITLQALVISPSWYQQLLPLKFSITVMHFVLNCYYVTVSFDTISALFGSRFFCVVSHIINKQSVQQKMYISLLKPLMEGCSLVDCNHLIISVKHHSVVSFRTPRNATLPFL